MERPAGIEPVISWLEAKRSSVELWPLSGGYPKALSHDHRARVELHRIRTMGATTIPVFATGARLQTSVHDESIAGILPCPA